MLHREQINHSDISSSLISLNTRGEAKLNFFSSENKVPSEIFSKYVTMYSSQSKRKFSLENPNTYISKLMGDKKVEDYSKQTRVDIFRFGLTLLECFMGGFDLLSEQCLDCSHVRKCCCLVHCSLKSAPPNSFGLHSLLERTSEDFKEFLCLCLKFNEHKRADICSLLTHNWIRNNKQI